MSVWDKSFLHPISEFGPLLRLPQYCRSDIGGGGRVSISLLTKGCAYPEPTLRNKEGKMDAPLEKFSGKPVHSSSFDRPFGGYSGFIKQKREQDGM
jgi:hypothetical protein